MEITVHLFGAQAAIAGVRETTLTLDAPSPTAASVLQALGEHIPELSDSLRTSRLAVNHEFASAEQPIRPGDEVALIGMVSGG